MAVRRPLVYDDRPTGFHLYELNDTEIQDIIDGTASTCYAAYPATILSVVSSGGTLPGLPIADTRQIAGTSTSRVDRFATEAETPNISITNVSYARITQTIPSASIPADTNNLRWPVYLDGSGNIRAMTSTDFYDTFVVPALAVINSATSGSGFASLTNDYIMWPSLVPPSGYALVSGTPVFSDTRANTDAYTAAGIGETLDQPFGINNYYLYKNNGTGFTSLGFFLLYFDAGTEQLRTYTIEEWRATLGPWLKYYKTQSGNTTTYHMNSTGNPGNVSGTTMGSVMLNTQLVATGTGYTQRFVNDDDYRTQEFPNGTVTAVAQHELKKYTV